MMESPGRVAFSIAGFDVMWYGIMIALGIVCGFLVIYYRAPKYHEISHDRAFNMIILVLIAALVGLRVYYVAFNWDFYGAHPEEILNFRAGGLAIHGGLIFGCVMVMILARVYKERFFNIADLFFVGVPLGQAIGRWGNFFNSEAHGTHTDLPWAIVVNGDTVHPTFLYESIWCLILFGILWFVDNRRKFVGQTFLLYCILYSVERFFVEGLRTDSLIARLPWGEYRQAQILSVCVVIVALIFYVVFARRQRASEAIVPSTVGMNHEIAGTEEGAASDDEKTEGAGREKEMQPDNDEPNDPYVHQEESEKEEKSK